MSHCRICGASNPETALACRVCKSPIDKAEPGAMGGAAQRRQTVVEPGASQPQRGETVDESTHPWSPGHGDSSPAGKAYNAYNNAASGDIPRRRVTVFNPSAGDDPEVKRKTAPNAQPTSAARKIVGVLVTYSWSDQGQIFPVCEGRNRIGSDPEECDIVIPQDETLSAVNSHIIFRKNFTIGDEVSMGGTDVDGEPIETAFVPLRNYARIRTGSTHWTFIAVQPPAEDAGKAAE